MHCLAIPVNTSGLRSDRHFSASCLNPCPQACRKAQPLVRTSALSMCLRPCPTHAILLDPESAFRSKQATCCVIACIYACGSSMHWHATTLSTHQDSNRGLKLTLLAPSKASSLLIPAYNTSHRKPRWSLRPYWWMEMGRFFLSVSTLMKLDFV
ncbi:hypothetical protein BKA65DRAFT_144891 [Rhexocercosporidium sp. MPI-PUGE-AT-0058]|nr:hypothetical protein BKA65DRAFT_144891 [Rhexocercosporidium sp. MPI-PUGE-AT-0058]